MNPISSDDQFQALLQRDRNNTRTFSRLPNEGVIIACIVRYRFYTRCCITRI